MKPGQTCGSGGQEPKEQDQKDTDANRQQTVAKVRRGPRTFAPARENKL